MTKVRKKIGTIPINDIEQQVQQSTQAAVTQMQQDVQDFINEETAQYPEIGGALKFQEDPEGRSEITTDSESKIISYRDADGVKHEEVGIVLGNSAMTEFQKALSRSGFQGGGMNFSDKEIIELPEPKHYGMLNLIVESLPLQDGDVSEGLAEYYDYAGNYLRIPCSVEPQGQTSRIFAATGGKGNYTLDLSKEIKFGCWVPQDSFHLKGNAKDVTRGILPTSYKLAWRVMNYLNAKPDRVLRHEEDITTTAATGNRMTDWPTDARCLPDGFPVELYINGEYWGLYSLQLKKHRKNYSMDKKDYESFFIDADALMTDDYTTGIWNEGPDRWWDKFEIKNPKDLVCMDGSAYDGDSPKELIDETSEFYDPTNKKHKGSKKTKEIIKSFTTKYLEVKNLIANQDTAAAKSKFAEYFDVNACMLVYIFNCTMGNGDSIMKNTLWGTWSNGKIAPMLWDLDGMYGHGWIGYKVDAPVASLWTGSYATAEWPLALFWALYETEIKTAYANLRKNGIIDMNIWHDVVYGEWIDRIGKEAFERDLERWPETPSYRENYTNTEYWHEEGRIIGTGGYPVWNGNDSYAADDYVVLSMYGSSTNYMLYKAIQPSTGVCPVTKFYDNFPTVGGFYDSPERMEKWMIEQINLCDTLLGYTE